jgi:ribosomal-protein-alanine N-acetyltransferase
VISVAVRLILSGLHEWRHSLPHHAQTLLFIHLDLQKREVRYCRVNAALEGMVIVRNARSGELEVLSALGLAAWQKGIAPLVPAEVAARLSRTNPFVPFLKALGSNVLVAEINGRPAGIGARERQDDEISDVWVDPAFEGRGAGSGLVKALEDRIRAAGFATARIRVAASNDRALGLYKHLGYREVWRKVALDPVLNIELEKIGLEKWLAAAA